MISKKVKSYEMTKNWSNFIENALFLRILYFLLKYDKMG
jgi:hypothetical protein